MTATSIHDELAQAHHPRGAVDRAPGAVATAFAELGDRHSLLNHKLDELSGLVGDLEARLSPVLTDVAPGVAGLERDPGNPEPIDQRGAVARQISNEARHADGMAGQVTVLAGRIGRLLDNLEV